MKFNGKFFQVFTLIFYSTLFHAFAQPEVFPFKENNRWGLLDQENRVLIKPLYENIQYMDWTEKLLFIQSKNQGLGIVTYLGDTLLAPSLNYSRFISWQPPYYQVRNQEGKIAFYNFKTGQFVSEFIFDEASIFLNDSLGLVTINNKKGLYDLSSKSFKVKCEYENLETLWMSNRDKKEPEEDYLAIKNNGLYAVYNLQRKKFLTDFLFPQINNLFPDQNITVRKDDRCAIYSIKQKKFLTQYVFSANPTYVRNNFYITVKQEGYTLFDAVNNKELLPPTYRYIYTISPESNPAQSDHVVLDDGENRGVYSIPLKKIIIPTQYKDITMRRTTAASQSNAKAKQNGIFVCQNERGYVLYSNVPKYFFDLEGNPIQADKAEAIIEPSEFGEEDMAIAEMRDDDLPGLTIKRKGPDQFSILTNRKEYVISGFNSIFTFRAITKNKSNGFFNRTQDEDTLLIGKSKGKYTFINRNGSISFPVQFDSIPTNASAKKLWRNQYIPIMKDQEMGFLIHYRKPFMIVPMFNVVDPNEYFFTQLYGFRYQLVSTDGSNKAILDLGTGIFHHPTIKATIIKTE